MTTAEEALEGLAVRAAGGQLLFAPPEGRDTYPTLAGVGPVKSCGVRFRTQQGAINDE